MSEYHLVLGDPAYSSWSLRGWLLFHRWDIPCSTAFVSFSDDRSVAEQMPDMAPAKTVPALRLPDGAILGDSLAIAEEVAARHPDHAMWPTDPAFRARARDLTAEMHAGFMALRNACPMNLRCAYGDFTADDAVERDLARLDVIWTHALNQSGGPWLCGDYSIADAFYAPVAARIAGYGLAISFEAADYVAAHLADRSFLVWRQMGLTQGPDLKRYAMDNRQVPWPGPAG
ncbi:glutathione S-transferase [Actibacterium sp. 188UL27-1]|uniref:glutathione S-transferase n=1 Tax=Actibacterium sp. 188UL27-1 TaxID=2786961 RepID=UPI001957C8D9|nr:glutathione S-transferase [Actibacterium sp. 188UL27-1]MBM7068120.1 glutathione S-transferase [Actibacterium sp. 188UL27-1]